MIKKVSFLVNLYRIPKTLNNPLPIIHPVDKPLKIAKKATPNKTRATPLILLGLDE